MGARARVELRSVSKTYGAVRALVRVSAKFDAGCVTAVLGPNGSGKSTLLALVGTLARATSGEVDHGALGRGADVRRVLGWVGHESLCYVDLSGRENVELVARMHGLDPKAAYARVAERFDLAAFGDAQCRTYSRGQRQRVALARALVHDPGLVLLDEPTTGLDSRMTERLVGVVKEEARRGAVVLVVTHDLEFAEAEWRMSGWRWSGGAWSRGGGIGFTWWRVSRDGGGHVVRVLAGLGPVARGRAGHGHVHGTRRERGGLRGAPRGWPVRGGGAGGAWRRVGRGGAQGGRSRRKKLSSADA